MQLDCLWFGLLKYLWCPVMRKLMFAAKVWWGQNQKQSICRTSQSATLSDWICTENKGCQQTFPASVYLWISLIMKKVILWSCRVATQFIILRSPGGMTCHENEMSRHTVQYPVATEHHPSHPELSRLPRPTSCSSSSRPVSTSTRFEFRRKH